MNTFLAKKYLKYVLFSWHKNGHGIHSPFVYNLIRDVFQDKKQYPEYGLVSSFRKSYLKSEKTIEIVDFGAGSKVFKDNKRSISHIASVSAMTDKYGELLMRMVRYFNPQNIVELGTCLGVGTAWQAVGCRRANVYTIEGDPSLHHISKESVEQLGVKNVTFIQGRFEDTLPQLLQTIPSLDFVFIDGNHSEKPTIDYFEQCKSKVHAGTVLVFDDIHLSEEMERAWTYIKADNTVSLTVDVFRFGFVFFNEGVAKQDFVVRV